MIRHPISSINLAPVRNIRPWFPAGEHEIAFRVATDEEVFYVGFPCDPQLPNPEESDPHKLRRFDAEETNRVSQDLTTINQALER